MFKKGQNSVQDEDRPGRPKLISTPEMADSVNVLIFIVRRVTIEANWEFLWVQHIELCMKALPCPRLEVVGFSLGQCKFSYCCKNSGNHISVWFRNSCFILFTVQIWALWFPLVWPLQKYSALNKVFKQWWSKEHHEQIAKNSVQKFLY